MKRRKKANILGLNYEWFEKYFFPPLIIIIFLIIFIMYSRYRYIKYMEYKYESYIIEESERLIKESIKESKEYTRYLKESESIRLEEYKKKKEEDEYQKRKANVEFENKVFSSYWPKGTYIHDKKRNLYGRISHCMVPEIFTYEGWSFELHFDERDNDIEQVGWKDWHDYTKKMSEKQTEQNNIKLNELLKNSYLEREAEALKKFPKNPKYGYCKYNGEYYFITNWKNGVLKLRHRFDDYKYPNNIYVQYDDPNVLKLNKEERRKFNVVKD